MKVIKFPILDFEVANTFEVPDDFTPLHVAEQHGVVQVWGETTHEEPREAPKRDMTFFIVGTGWDVRRDPTKAHYIGTVLMNGGSLVWHFYWSYNKEAVKYATPA
jgi:hypothetical protein